MKKLLFVLMLSGPAAVFGQSKSISLVSKSKEPVIVSAGDTLKVGQEIQLALGSNENGSFKYVQLLSGMNEPIGNAESRFAMKKQDIKFFKIQDGTTYVFTKFFVINIEAALLAKEVKYAGEK